MKHNAILLLILGMSGGAHAVPLLINCPENIQTHNTLKANGYFLVPEKPTGYKIFFERNKVEQVLANVGGEEALKNKDEPVRFVGIATDQEGSGDFCYYVTANVVDATKAPTAKYLYRPTTYVTALKI